MTTALIPQINIAPLFAEDRPARAAVDAAIFAAAQEIGFLTITGMPRQARSITRPKRLLFDCSAA